MPRSEGLLMPPLFGSRMHAGMPPMQHCLAVNAWITAAVGALLPLFVQSRLQAAARRRFNEQRRQQQQQRTEGAQRGSGQLEVQRMGWITVYCLSFYVWLLLDIWYGWPPLSCTFQHTDNSMSG